MAEPKIILYTSHGCPWAHRVHIAVRELGLAYEEVIIDLQVPREPWYLEINPVWIIPKLRPEYSCGLTDLKIARPRTFAVLQRRDNH